MKPILRGYRNQLRRAYRKIRYPFTEEDLVKGLEDCGIQLGDSVFVHSSISNFDGFRGGGLDAIAALRRAVGEGGTLLMPTLSFTGSAVAYATKPRVFDPARSPSLVGMLPELFRRSPGVSRSLHPTHSVAAAGPRSEWFLKDHHLAESPCGRGTPYYRLLEAEGKILLLDVGLSSMTFYHTIEELIEPLMREPALTQTRYIFPIRVGKEIIQSPPMRLFEPSVSARRTLAPLERALREGGMWKSVKVANIVLTVVTAKDSLAAAEALAKRGIFCYRETGDRP
ncbi:MAG TPA: AAC(3) family N-acetyltransferase [Candidatus Limnocylindrales bacterium]|nr:AAC(3) family N-acetyltransferase [Candidatus Limnocylindrales bacterium]